MNELAFIKLGIYRFTLWYGNLNSRTLIGKENYIPDLFDAHGAFCYARYLTFIGCLYVLTILLFGGLINENPRLIAGDICERSIVVFREPFQHLFGDSSPSNVLLFCQAMRHPFSFLNHI
jgi:hypothetical protein